MPRKAKGARLYLRPAKRDARAVWVIKDAGGYERSTGWGADARGEAEKALAAYIAKKYEPPRRDRSLASTPVADVISVYLDDVAPGQARPEKAAERAGRLLQFFGAMTVDAITGALCRDYAAWRGSPGGARRDLQDLQAALNHGHKAGLYREVVRVTLPPAGPARSRWLTRGEVARLVWICLTTRERQGAWVTQRRPLRHLARFILIGVYTGSRPGAILGLNWEPTTHRGWVDLDAGLIYRRATGARETAKRQPPVPIAPELLRLMRRWAAADGCKGPVVRWQGEPVLSVKTGLGRAVQLAGLDVGVSAYTLRHTTASWLVQGGEPTRKVAAFLGTSEALVEKTYGHLAPDHLRSTAGNVGRGK